MARGWDNLSDYEFEGLVGDLLGVELGIGFERFTRGRDGGIDLRHIPPDGGNPDIAQAKHYKGSTMSHLRRSARKEAARLRDAGIETSSYRLVTSLGLTPANKRELAEILAPWIERDDHVLGRDDLESLLDRHPAVERRHVKLWLGSAAQLAATVHAGTRARSRVLTRDIERTLPLYVQGDSFHAARELLWEHRVVLIAGQPGIGKTTLARMLVADAIAKGYEPIEVSSNIDEAWEIWDPDTRQIFVYDDFLGRTVLGELSKNEDSRLLSFMREATHSTNTLLVLTTREYILREALQAFEAFRRNGLDTTRFLLELPSYSRLDRARILHNHVWHSELPLTAKEELAIDRGYRRVVEHRNFNPRVIEYITGLQPGHPLQLGDDESWLEFAVKSLERPTEIWRQAYERELGDTERNLLLCLATMPDEAQIDDLRRAFDSWAELAGLTGRPQRFESALRVVEDTFTTSRLREGDELFVALANPGLTDFLQQQLMAEPQLISIALRSAAFFEQAQTIWRLRDKATAGVRRQALATHDLTSAVERLWNEDGARWIRISYGVGPDRYLRVNTTADARLNWLIGVARDAEAPAGSPELAEGRLRDRIESWERGEGDEFVATQIALRLLGDGPPAAPDGWRSALVRMGTTDLGTLDSWEAAVELTELLPEELDEDFEAELADEFRDFVSEELGYHHAEIESEDELARLEEVAAALNVRLASHELEEARERIEERLRREEGPDDRDDWDRGRMRDALAEAEEIDAMFGRLTD